MADSSRLVVFKICSNTISSLWCFKSFKKRSILYFISAEALFVKVKANIDLKCSSFCLLNSFDIYSIASLNVFPDPADEFIILNE